MRLSDAEWKVMNVVWSAAPARARDVLEALQGETSWAYTTVKTMLDRLVEKGALKSDKRASTSLYEPAISRGEARRSAVRALLDRAFDGAFGPMMAFLVQDESLSARDRAELNRLLEAEAPDESGPK